MLSAVWNTAGGMRYHWRALRHARAWAPFRAELSVWLESWRPGRRSLGIVGPSAGYCLPLPALAQFERFVIFEVDPLACLLLKRRMQRALPGRSIVWITSDMWIEPLLRGGELPSALLGPDSAVLFANIVGQMPYLIDADVYADWQRAWCDKLFPWLAHMPWASFHDRVSGAVPPYEALPKHGRQLSDAEVSALYEGDPTQSLIELNDHRSQELLPSGHDYRYLHWPLEHDMHHLIECVQGGPRAEVPGAADDPVSM
jgi:hypothetical protein